MLSSTEGKWDLQTRFADKTMPERCVSRSKYSFKNRLDSNSTMRRSASLSPMPIIRGQQNAPPLMPKKSAASNSGNHYSNDPTVIPKQDNNLPPIPRRDNNAPPIPRKSSPNNKGI